LTIDWEKEKYGNINKTQITNKDKSFTVIQLLNKELKNELGESNIEVRKRMKEAILSIIKNNKGKKIAIISHGAAIKFFLQDFCVYDEENDCLKYNEKFVCPIQLVSPSMIKIIFNSDSTNLYEIKDIYYEE